MGHSDKTAKTTADTGLVQGQQVAQQTNYNPYATAVINQQGQNLQDIQAGKFGGLPLVNAVKAGADRARSWNPAPLGDAALAANASGGSGYATAENEMRKRMLDNTVSNLVPQAVEQERNYATGVLFPGAQAESAFGLAKSAALTGNANAAANLYNMSSQNGFWNHLTNSFGNSLGSTLGGANLSYNSQNGSWTGGFG